MHNAQILAFIAIVLLICSSIAHAQTAVTGSIKTDKGVYLPGAAPTLLKAGDKTVDPIFGTEILRASDASDGGWFQTAYSYWPTFNKDNTKILLTGSQNLIRDFNPVTFTLGAKTPLPAPTLCAGYNYSTAEDAIFSQLDANILLTHCGTLFLAYDLTQQKFSTIGDLTARLPAGAYLAQQSISDSDSVTTDYSSRNGR